MLPVTDVLQGSYTENGSTSTEARLYTLSDRMSSTTEGINTTQDALKTYSDIIDPMSTATMHIIETIIQVALLPPIVLFGVIANVINMAVFARQGLSDKVNLCLFCLALCDTGYMLSLMTWRSYAIFFLVSEQWGEFWKSRFLNAVGVYHSFTDTSDVLTMLIALDRCICVLWPLKAKAILDIRKVRLFVVLAFLVCFSTNLLFSAKYDVRTYVDPVTNVTRYATTVTSFYLRYHNVVDNVFENTNIVIPVLCFTVVIIATVLIVVRMRSMAAWRQDSANLGGGANAASKSNAALTRMLTVICVIFTLCLIPYVLAAFFRLVVPEYRPEGRYSNTLFATTAITHLFLSINSSISFVIYYRMSSRYRATLHAVLGRKPVTWDRSEQSALAVRTKGAPDSCSQFSICENATTVSAVSVASFVEK